METISCAELTAVEGGVMTNPSALPLLVKLAAWLFGD